MNGNFMNDKIFNHNQDDAPETFEYFAKYICNRCISNEWYCPSYCDILEKASKIDYEILKKKFIQHNGDVQKLCRFIKHTKRDKQNEN